MLKDINQTVEANELLQQALISQGNNLNLRSYYTYFLCQSGQMKLAKDLVFTTLKDHDKHDLYALCAAGYILYQQARENRESTPEGVKARRRNFERAVEFYDKALMLDSTCAVAAQGLAIVSADDALGTLSGIATADDSARRSQSTREALDVFAKVRETLSDGSVYANMGHCYYARDEFERALECVSLPILNFLSDINVLSSMKRHQKSSMVSGTPQSYFAYPEQITRKQVRIKTIHIWSWRLITHRESVSPTIIAFSRSSYAFTGTSSYAK